MPRKATRVVPRRLADRPSLPPSYGIRKANAGRGLLGWEHVSSRMSAARNYWIATVSRKGRPHVAPVWGLWLEERFFFATDSGSKKARNLDANPSISVHLESGDEVVVIEGVAEKAADPHLIKRLDAAYFRKYAVHLAAGQVYQVEAIKVFSWSEADFPESATRWQIRGNKSEEGA